MGTEGAVTATEAGVPEAGKKYVSPEYSTLSSWFPTDNAGIATVAKPDAKVTAGRWIRPSMLIVMVPPG
ncbi:hypothetical protein J2S89_000067 [Arthrobacter bambusae]|nr:hypothetical protein [Arthrobacter bambusae]MDQ0028259.1 hypothetical protein [Arthrobacter bambusae]MDQ0096947.1 hypothetical protein [Arthrobacter bambusae]